MPPALARLVRWSAVTGLAAAGLALVWLHAMGTPLGLPLVLAVTGGSLATLVTAGALMGLLFHSSRSGLDDAVERHGRQLTAPASAPPSRPRPARTARAGGP